MKKMKKVPKRQWLKALRSGEYNRGEGQLVEAPADNCHQDGEYYFCCLGVLQNVYCESKGMEFHRHEFSAGAHSNEVAKWSGLDNDAAYLEDEDMVHIKPNKNRPIQPFGYYEAAWEYLAGMNDKGKSFKEIARWIEKNL